MTTKTTVPPTAPPTESAEVELPGAGTGGTAVMEGGTVVMNTYSNAHVHCAYVHTYIKARV